MTTSEAASHMGRLGAEKRQQLEREPILSKARAMREAAGLPPSPALNPPLILTASDRA
jgi:hypothetical protein